MPQFYPGDNLECWFATCFIEHYESLEADDKGVAMHYSLAVVERGCHLTEAEQFLGLMGLEYSGGPGSNFGKLNLVDAIMNSVDWEDVLERFKTAIDYDEKTEADRLERIKWAE